MPGALLRPAMVGLFAVMCASCGGAQFQSVGSPRLASTDHEGVEAASSDANATGESEAPVVIESVGEPVTETAVQDSYLPQLSLSAVEGMVDVTGETFFKAATSPSSTLSAEQKCGLKKGVSLGFVALGKEIKQGHRWVQLVEAPQGCSFKEGYFFMQHVRLSNKALPFVEPKIATRIKLRLADSTQLAASEWCSLEVGRRYTLVAAPVDAGRSHDFVRLAPGQIEKCAVAAGYLYRPHFQAPQPKASQPQQPSEPPATSDFVRVMKPILRWEGGCSDHPADTGGRTYKGITTAVARRKGWSGDVCTMPDSRVYEIYRTDYWQARAARYDWPLNLAIMNTEVNSGGGMAQRFLDRMAANKIGGSLVDQALWFLQQQVDFYHRIVANNPSQQVFLRGWLNRSDYMRNVIKEVPGFSLVAQEEPDFIEATAKAYESEDALELPE